MRFSSTTTFALVLGVTATGMAGAIVACVADPPTSSTPVSGSDASDLKPTERDAGDAAVVGPPMDAGENLLPNGDFSLGCMVGRELTAASVMDITLPNGRRACRVCNTSAQQFAFAQFTTPLNPPTGQGYRLTAKVQGTPQLTKMGQVGLILAAPPDGGTEFKYANVVKGLSSETTVDFPFNGQPRETIKAIARADPATSDAGTSCFIVESMEVTTY